jgi:hypothetical protein
MNDCMTMLRSLRRSRLLITAARLGARDYRRERDLKRLIRLTSMPGPRQAIMHLLQIEAELEESRNLGDGRYSCIRHVEVMIALVAEAALVKPARGPEELPA